MTKLNKINEIRTWLRKMNINLDFYIDNIYIYFTINVKCQKINIKFHVLILFIYQEDLFNL